MSEAVEDTLFDHQGGTAAPWYRGWAISDEKRDFFRARSARSREAKLRALAGVEEPLHPLNTPALDPAVLMPTAPAHGLGALSLFSGGGGLDLGFERAGYSHVASYDTLEAAGLTLCSNRPDWQIKAGEEGDVREVDWREYRDKADVIHGGPPCQPFSAAGRQRGHKDERNMLPEFVRAVREVRPLAFIAENVPALAGPKFAPYLAEAFVGPLSRSHHIVRFRLSAHDFGVPQVRHRVFFVGFLKKRDAARFESPAPSHRADHLARGPAAAIGADIPTMGARAALGLPDVGFDTLAPTLRSTLTGPRHTTSVLSMSGGSSPSGRTALPRRVRLRAASRQRMDTSASLWLIVRFSRASRHHGLSMAPSTWRWGRSATRSRHLSPTAWLLPWRTRWTHARTSLLGDGVKPPVGRSRSPFPASEQLCGAAHDGGQPQG
jgi:DNA (cytosine-5)-methyltransferase 1